MSLVFEQPNRSVPFLSADPELMILSRYRVGWAVENLEKPRAEEMLVQRMAKAHQRFPEDVLGSASFGSWQREGWAWAVQSPVLEQGLE